MKIIFLIPPSEGKNVLGKYKTKNTTYYFPKPVEIIKNVSEKDLKCSGKRFLEGIELNKNIDKGPFLETINRYNGVMYNSIGFNSMNNLGQKYFLDKFYILSGMYGILRPDNLIGNYKLPIETKGLAKFWQEKITDTLNNINADLIIDLLPISYKKMINFKNLKKDVLEVNFINSDTNKKISHGVKSVKGAFIRYICENNIKNSADFINFNYSGISIEVKIKT